MLIEDFYTSPNLLFLIMEQSDTVHVKLFISTYFADRHLKFKTKCY